MLTLGRETLGRAGGQAADETPFNQRRTFREGAAILIVLLIYVRIDPCLSQQLITRFEAGPRCLGATGHFWVRLFLHEVRVLF